MCWRITKNGRRIAHLLTNEQMSNINATCCHISIRS
nr:MAG TPA_asm: hypothetical protein [Caudoviricetes sp.]